LRQSTKERRPYTRYNLDEYVALTYKEKPQSYKKAMANSHQVEWAEDMQEEMKSLHENHTYDLVELPRAVKAFTK